MSTHTELIAAIKQRVGAAYGVTAQDIEAPGRKQPAALARQVAMALCRKHVTAPIAGRPNSSAALSYPEIGKAFGNRSHMTVMHACRVVAEQCGNDPRFAARVAEMDRAMANTTMSQPGGQTHEWPKDRSE